MEFNNGFFLSQWSEVIVQKYRIIEEIITGGSDRRFYRVEKDNKTYILIEDKNIKDYVRILNHLSRAGIGVPELFETGVDKIIIEDLGTSSLYEIMKKHNTDWQKFYLMAIDELIKLQIDGRKDAPINLYYDDAHIRWEQEYFKKFFLGQFCQIPEKELKTIKDEMDYLYEELIRLMKPVNNYLMHRDYQSQNIFIKDNRIRIIDFQSARIGPLTYDLASLLRDAYVVIEKDSELFLIEYYLERLKERGINIAKDEFLKIYRFTALQRNMQALGAFANLSLNKKKFHFKKFIPHGIKLLKRGLTECKFNNLQKVIIKTIEQLNNCLIV